MWSVVGRIFDFFRDKVTFFCVCEKKAVLLRAELKNSNKSITTSGKDLRELQPR